MDVAFRFRRCREDVMTAVSIREMAIDAEHETEATTGPMIEGDASFDTGNRVVGTEEELTYSYIQGAD